MPYEILTALNYTVAFYVQSITRQSSCYETWHFQGNLTDVEIASLTATERTVERWRILETCHMSCRQSKRVWLVYVFSFPDTKSRESQRSQWALQMASWLLMGGGGGSAIQSAPALFLFFKVEDLSGTLIPLSLFTPGSVNSGAVNWDDCGQVFSDELRVSSFPW